jgi:RNA polymerase sigma factor (sigma-70 family)
MLEILAGLALRGNENGSRIALARQPVVTTITRPWMRSIETAQVPDAAVADPAAESLRLFEAHGAGVLRFCRAMLGNRSDAEDIVQDTFLKLLLHLRSGGDRSNLRGWLFAVAANACRDRATWRMRWLPWRVDLDRRAVEAPDDAPDLGPVRAAFAALAPRDRLLLSLRAQGLSYREIGAAARVTEVSVGRLLARAVDRWKKKHLATR